MAVWVDAQLSPAVAGWLPDLLSMPAIHVRALDLHRSDDPEIFHRAAAPGMVILTKDADFRLLLDRFGPPPRVIWLTCGNTSNAELRRLLTHHAQALRAWLAGDEPLVEIA